MQGGDYFLFDGFVLLSRQKSRTLVYTGLQGSNLQKNSAFPSENLAKNLLVRTNFNFSELLLTNEF